MRSYGVDRVAVASAQDGGINEIQSADLTPALCKLFLNDAVRILLLAYL